MLIYIFLTISFFTYTVLFFFFFMVTFLGVWHYQNMWLSRSLGTTLSHEII